mmetsp:Transcript_43490/g.131570  ORF Transcript_43490/g.131570 Transcript_43490/m.131570 type:complete len:201 (-) Transcript_43490:849-1451(-)
MRTLQAFPARPRRALQGLVCRRRAATGVAEFHHDVAPCLLRQPSEPADQRPVARPGDGAAAVHVRVRDLQRGLAASGGEPRGVPVPDARGVADDHGSRLPAGPFPERHQLRPGEPRLRAQPLLGARRPLRHDLAAPRQVPVLPARGEQHGRPHARDIHHWLLPLAVAIEATRESAGCVLGRHCVNNIRDLQRTLRGAGVG